MQLDKLLFFFRGPLVSLDASSEVVVVSLSALFATAANNPESLFHNSGNLTPLGDTFILEQSLKGNVFLNSLKCT
jgi:hypothetical protein